MFDVIREHSELFALGLGTVIGATTVLATAHLGQRRIAIQNITQERRKWRKTIRMKALEVHDALICPDEVAAKLKLERLQAEMRCLLNPSDNYDNNLLEIISVPNCTCIKPGLVCCTKQCESGFNQARIFSKHVASLLKHDWERSKLEASSLPRRLYLTGCLIKHLFSEPERQFPSLSYSKPWKCRRSYHEKRLVALVFLAVLAGVALCLVA